MHQEVHLIFERKDVNFAMGSMKTVDYEPSMNNFSFVTICHKKSRKYCFIDFSIANLNPKIYVPLTVRGGKFPSLI